MSERIELTRRNLLKIIETPPALFCRYCKEKQDIDPDVLRAPAKRQTKRNQIIINFIEIHFGRHMQEARKKLEQAQRDFIDRDKIADTIAIDTRRAGPKQYNFYVSYRNRVRWLEDDIIPYGEDSDDFIRAVIVNLGKACRWFADNCIMNGCVILEQEPEDRGKYERYHVVVYHLLFPESNFESKKNASLFESYQPYLRRVRELRDQWHITIKLSEI